MRLSLSLVWTGDRRRLEAHVAVDLVKMKGRLHGAMFALL